MNKLSGYSVSGVRRRLLAGAAFSAVAWAGAVRAQVPEKKIRKIGLLSVLSPSNPYRPFGQRTFGKSLRDLGWIEGNNIIVEQRYADGRAERLAELAAELVRLKVDVIVALSPPASLAAQEATTSIPVVMTFTGDPVFSGPVKSLARPGGNVTGFSQMARELIGKRLELLKEMVPMLHRVAVLVDPSIYSYTSRTWKELELSARQLNVQLHKMEVRNASEFEQAFDAAIRARADALFVFPAPLIELNLQRIALLAVKHGLPSTYNSVRFANAGGLVTYGPDPADIARSAAAYVDKIFKGAKPGELPIEQPTVFEFVVNLTTAKALGIKIPQSILVRADRVIE